MTWDTLQRSTILRANQLQADTAAALATSYTLATIGQTQMSDRAIEFPFVAINDALLDACDRIISAISMNVESPYRTFFAGVSGNISSGLTIPLVSTLSIPRVGMIGTVRDAATTKKMIFRPYEDVIGVSTMSLKQVPFWYFSDNVRVWHTKSNVILDLVVWDKSTQLTAMSASPRGDCPFPQDLHETIIAGALSYLFRGDFNTQQISTWRNYFESKLASLGAN